MSCVSRRPTSKLPWRKLRVGWDILRMVKVMSCVWKGRMARCWLPHLSVISPWQILRCAMSRFKRRVSTMSFSISLEKLFAKSLWARKSVWGLVCVVMVVYDVRQVQVHAEYTTFNYAGGCNAKSAAKQTAFD